MTGRDWIVTLKGQAISATGPEGNSWFAAVDGAGYFKAAFKLIWQGEPKFDVAIVGNVKHRFA